MRHPKSGYRIYRHEDLQAVLDLPDAADVDFSPRVDWSEMGEAEHFVQFYESDGFLVDSVSGFVAAALQAGEGAVVIATEAHRQAIQLRLEASELTLRAHSPPQILFPSMLLRHCQSSW